MTFTSPFLQPAAFYAPDIQVATTGQILPLVQNGLGLGFVPERLGRQALEGSDLVAIRLTEPLPQRTASLVTDPAVPWDTRPKCSMTCCWRRHREGNSHESDLTQGRITSSLLRFAWPFMVGNLLQQPL